MSHNSNSGFPARDCSKLTSSTIASLSTNSRFHSATTKATKQAVKNLIAIYRNITAPHKAAVRGKSNITACSSTTLFDTEATTPWDDTTSWDASSSWATTPVEQVSASGAWDDSCANSTETPATTISGTKPQSITINGITIDSPFLASFLASGTSLDLSAAIKHELAVYLKRTIEVSCFSFLTAESPWILDLLRLESYDDIDINVYIILLEYLRSAHHIPSTAFAASATSWPEIKSFCTEKPCSRDTIGRLRQVAVHRWDYNTHLLRDVIGFLALLKDHTRITDIESTLHRLHDQGVGAIPHPTCATKTELLATIVRILERSLYTKAQEHCPAVLTTNAIGHEHSAELSHLAEHVLSSLASSSSFSALEIEDSIYFCRSLRNIAAHHNSFTPEAILGRKEGGSVTCRYDAYPDPYAALAKDAERVALMAGDEGAVGEIQLAVWAADTSVSNRARKQSDSAADHGAQYYIDLARKADLEKSRLNGEDARGWEAVRTLYLRYSESAEYFEKRAVEARGELGKWAEDVVRDL